MGHCSARQMNFILAFSTSNILLVSSVVPPCRPIPVGGHNLFCETGGEIRSGMCDLNRRRGSVRLSHLATTNPSGNKTKVARSSAFLASLTLWKVSVLFFFKLVRVYKSKGLFFLVLVFPMPAEPRRSRFGQRQ